MQLAGGPELGHEGELNEELQALADAGDDELLQMQDPGVPRAPAACLPRLNTHLGSQQPRSSAVVAAKASTQAAVLHLANTDLAAERGEEVGELDDEELEALADAHSIEPSQAPAARPQGASAQQYKGTCALVQQAYAQVKSSTALTCSALACA